MNGLTGPQMLDEIKGLRLRNEANIAQMKRLVLRLLAAGVSEAGIARETGLSRTTIRKWAGK